MGNRPRRQTKLILCIILHLCQEKQRQVPPETGEEIHGVIGLWMIWT